MLSPDYPVADARGLPAQICVDRPWCVFRGPTRCDDNIEGYDYSCAPDHQPAKNGVKVWRGHAGNRPRDDSTHSHQPAPP